jgi:uncharacterized membrane protein YhaH (DUF805 family)
MPIGQFLFSFNGRLNRMPYWLTNLALLVIVVFVFVLIVMLDGGAALTEPFGWRRMAPSHYRLRPNCLDWSCGQLEALT